MIILSNGFPTNMPDSEEISQGGPANFARLFSEHLVLNTSHKWIGVMFCVTASGGAKIRKTFTFPQREYFKLYINKKLFKKTTHAKKAEDPIEIWEEPIKRIVSLIKREKPDVIFLNGFGLLNWVLLKAAEQTNVPVVIQHAGIWTKELRLHKKIFTPASLKIMEKMEKESTELSSAEVFLNTWSRDYYQEHVAKKDNGLSAIIPLPFNFERFANNRKTIKRSFPFKKEGVFNIGTIARWDKIKNHRSILSLSQLAKKQKLPWQFYSVTKISSPNNLRVSEKKYRKNIKVINSLKREGVADFCHSMDLIIMPSIFDVSPTVVLEAIASKTPVAISKNIGYAEDFKKCGAVAWVIDFSNLKSALSKIKKIKGKPMPDSIKKYIVENHNHKRVFSSYLNLFEAVAHKELLSIPVDNSALISSL